MVESALEEIINKRLNDIFVDLTNNVDCFKKRNGNIVPNVYHFLWNGEYSYLTRDVRFIDIDTMDDNKKDPWEEAFVISMQFPDQDKGKIPDTFNDMQSLIACSNWWRFKITGSKLDMDLGYKCGLNSKDKQYISENAFEKYIVADNKTALIFVNKCVCGCGSTVIFFNKSEMKSHWRGDGFISTLCVNKVAAAKKETKDVKKRIVAKNIKKEADNAPVNVEKSETSINHLQKEEDSWEKRKQDCKNRYNERCAICWMRGILEIHHLTYRRKNNEQPRDLLCLCGGCHSIISKYGWLGNISDDSTLDDVFSNMGYVRREMLPRMFAEKRFSGNEEARCLYELLLSEGK